jgi:hypothetical protein
MQIAGSVPKGPSSMAEYSALARSLKNAVLRQHADWKPAWRKPEPKPAYDVVHHRRRRARAVHRLLSGQRITASRNVAVCEKGWVGSGNIGRNTTIVRSNYLLEGNAPFYEHSMKLWENLSHELNYNVMFSQRGIINLFHTPAQDGRHMQGAATP